MRWEGTGRSRRGEEEVWAWVERQNAFDEIRLVLKLLEKGREGGDADRGGPE